MSLGLEMRAALPEGLAENMFEAMADFLEAKAAGVLRNLQEYEDEGGGTMTADLHPAGEEVMISWTADEIKVSANTATVGPGFHAYVCGLLDAMAEEWDLQWEGEDKSGYFASRDFAALRAEMVRWVQSICGMVLDADRTKCVQLGLAMDSVYQYEAGALTPVGWRSWEWVEAVAAGNQSGEDFFAWWNEGLDARSYLGRALALMWTEVRWIAPITEEEERVLREVAVCLERARDLDGGLELPEREWNEILGYLGEVEEVDIEGGWEPNRLIGYRRGWVREALAKGWSILLPGNFQGDWEDGTWTGTNGEMTVNITLFTKQGPDAEKWTEEALRGMKEQGEQFEFEKNGLVGKACVYEAEDEEGAYWQLDGRMARVGKLGILTVAFAGEEDQEAALKVWRGLWVGEN